MSLLGDVHWNIGVGNILVTAIYSHSNKIECMFRERKKSNCNNMLQSMKLGKKYMGTYCTVLQLF